MIFHSYVGLPEGTGAKRRESSGMIHWLTINNNPSNPQQPIQQPYVKRTSKKKDTGWWYTYPSEK